MNRIFRTIAAGLTVAALHGATPRLKLDREINLNAMIQERAGLQPSTHSVVALAFSPDEKWIAVGVGFHYKPGTWQPKEFDSHIIVLPLKEGTGRSLQLDSDTGVAQGSLVWAPGSNVLAVDGQQGLKCYAIPGGEPWKDWRPDAQVAQMLGFIDARHGLAYASLEDRLQAKRQKAPLAVYTFDLTGHVVDVWNAPSLGVVTAVDPDRHFIAVAMDSRNPDPVFPILRYPGMAVVQDWSNVKPFGRPILAESGKTLCGVYYLGRDSGHASCRDIDTGVKIAEFKGFPAGQPASVSSQASRIILTHMRLVRGITEEYDMRGYHDRVVWDFRADKVVAEWVPLTQVSETGLTPPEDRRTEFGPSIISPSGRYIAEGTNGRLRIYEIPQP
jgi:hypothetical protein